MTREPRAPSDEPEAVRGVDPPTRAGAPGRDEDEVHEPESGPGEAGGQDERLGDGVEHLQVAAREVIAAARTFLDVVEDALADTTVATSVADLLGSVSQAVTGSRARSTSSGERVPDDPAGASDPAATTRRPGQVQHIDVS